MDLSIGAEFHFAFAFEAKCEVNIMLAKVTTTTPAASARRFGIILTGKSGEHEYLPGPKLRRAARPPQG